MFRLTRQRMLMAALVLVGLLTLNAAVRGFHHARRLQARSDEPIQAWMNIGYIAHTYHVHPEALHDAIGLPRQPPDRRPLWEIARQQGRSPDALVMELTAAVKAARAAPRPGRPPAAPPPRSQSRSQS